MSTYKLKQKILTYVGELQNETFNNKLVSKTNGVMNSSNVSRFMPFTDKTTSSHCVAIHIPTYTNFDGKS